MSRTINLQSNELADDCHRRVSLLLQYELLVFSDLRDSEGFFSSRVSCIVFIVFYTWHAMFGFSEM